MTWSAYLFHWALAGSAGGTVFLLLSLACLAPENGLSGPPSLDRANQVLPPAEPPREMSELGEEPRDPLDIPTVGEGDEDADGLYAEGAIHDFHITLPDASRSALGRDPRGWVDATFRSQRTSLPVKLHLKGTTTFRTLSGKAAFKIDFHADDPHARFHGRKRLTLNSMLQDSSMLHEHVAYWLFRLRGVPAPRHAYARVWVNDTSYGLYGVVETMDEQWLDRAFPGDDEGNLYEANLADFTPGSASRYELEESGGVFEPVADLEALIDTLDAAPPEDYLQALEDNFDADALFDMWAIDLVSGNVDGYSRLRNNYRVYHAPEAGRWYLLPWGFDQSFQWQRSVTTFREFPGHLVERCGEVPACTERLEAAIADLMIDWEAGPFAQMVSDASGAIGADCRADPRAELPCDVGHVLAFTLSRAASVREDLHEAEEERAEEESR